ncbi:hypothetical protein GLE_1269 [Lysobacter enzymogenes]|uniref:Uncharacterized protein n=1 Tax=Lysobacter enzymogenes TaxID=69 RepID=A0A0S2DDR3_LYSEN|nr:hypothetical protein GLE_1269 [Lysobacter enzymogenes]
MRADAAKCRAGKHGRPRRDTASSSLDERAAQRFCGRASGPMPDCCREAFSHNVRLSWEGLQARCSRFRSPHPFKPRSPPRPQAAPA